MLQLSIFMAAAVSENFKYWHCIMLLENKREREEKKKKIREVGEIRSRDGDQELFNFPWMFHHFSTWQSLSIS